VPKAGFHFTDDIEVALDFSVIVRLPMDQARVLSPPCRPLCCTETWTRADLNRDRWLDGVPRFHRVMPSPRKYTASTCAARAYPLTLLAALPVEVIKDDVWRGSPAWYRGLHDRQNARH
jgi:hypothetical protein